MDQSDPDGGMSNGSGLWVSYFDQEFIQDDSRYIIRIPINARARQNGRIFFSRILQVETCLDR